MTKLEKLIQKFCPGGVEYKTIKEIATDIYRGSGIKRDQVTPDGVPCVRYGEIYTTYGVWFDKCVSHTSLEYVASPKYFEHGDLLFVITGENVEDIAKSTAYIGYDKCLAGGDIVVVKHKQNPKYLSYALSTADARRQKSAGKVKSKVVHSSVPSIEALKIPVPPLEVQREIVRILDNFTALTAELSAELAARKKQYEFYRDKLLSFENLKRGMSKIICSTLAELGKWSGGKTFASDIRFERLGDTCNMKSGKAIPSLQIGTSYTNATPYPCFGGNGIRGYVSDASHHGDYPIIGRQGALCGNVNYATGNFYATEHAVVVESKGEYLQRFLYYLLISMNLNQYKSQGAQPGLAVGKLENLVAPVPALEVQKQLVHVLDNFEAICSDLNSGLPAEIEARQRQYEYYRDRLLSFPVKEA